MAAMLTLCRVGVAQEAIQEVYTAAITKAASDKDQVDLSNAFVAAFAQLPGKDDSDKLLDTLLSAVDYTITFNGCEQPKPFAKGGWGVWHGIITAPSQPCELCVPVRAPL